MSRRIRHVLVVGLAGPGVSWFALALSMAGVVYPQAAVPADSGSIPADVLARSDVARSHMKQIAAALLNYAWANQEQFPTNLTMLYPTYISDPRIFWHPGDSNPQPTTINNATLNQQNSVRISFEYTSATRLQQLCEDDPLIWDNSAANNKSLFINSLTWRGNFKANPAWTTPTPTRRETALRNLNWLASGLYVYLNETLGVFPTDLTLLVQTGIVCSPSTFWNPGDTDPEPTAITNSIPNATNSAQISYAYLGEKADDDGLSVIILDNSLNNNDGLGIHVVSADGSAEFYERSDRFLPSTVTARTNLQLIGAAVLAYASNNGGHFPPKLSTLYPSYISNPDTFWNPGDRDTCPTTITNDIPNAPKSTQISFRYLGGGLEIGSDPGGILAVDNDLSNNGGTGINVLTANGSVDYYALTPPSCQDPFSCSAMAAARLKRIGTALYTYANESNDRLPARLSELRQWGLITQPTVLWHPGDSDPYPLTIDNDVPNQSNSAQISFDFVAAGQDLDNMGPGDILVQDNSPAYNAGRGINALYWDGHVGFIPSLTLQSIAITSGPAVIPAGGFGSLTCTATYNDASTLDVTKHAAWSITSGPGGVSNEGTYASPLSLATGSSATIHVSYEENDVTMAADKTITVQICHDPFADADGDGDVDQDDFGVFQRCRSSASPLSELCLCFDRPELPSNPSGDGDVDQADLLKFSGCVSGPGIPANPGCDD